ncbi:MAG: prolipoprotein diacylglyceryl transferase [Armatimonadota bacterium]
MLPILFWIGPVPVYAYAVFSVAGILIGFWWAKREFARSGLPLAWLGKLLPFVILCALMGARLLHVAFHWQDYSDWQALIWRWRPGMSFHGAMFGSILGVWLAARYFKMPLMALLDALAPSAALGHAIGRVGCFVNGCCFGKVTQVAWAVSFRNPALCPDELPRHPTQLYEAFGLVMIFALLTGYSSRFKGERFWLWLGGYSALRFITEFWREGMERLWLLTYPQWLSLLLIAVASLGLTKCRKSAT